MQKLQNLETIFAAFTPKNDENGRAMNANLGSELENWFLPLPKRSGQITHIIISLYLPNSSSIPSGPSPQDLTKSSLAKVQRINRYQVKDATECQ